MTEIETRAQGMMNVLQNKLHQANIEVINLSGALAVEQSKNKELTEKLDLKPEPKHKKLKEVTK